MDDEKLARDSLRRTMESFPEGFNIVEAENGVEAIQFINDFDPDLIYLDIEMPGMSGIDVVLNFPDRPFAVIFQTAYDQFAVKAFEENALDYILKPASDERIRKSFDRYLNSHQSKAGVVQERIAKAGMTLENISIKSGNKIKIVDTKSIQFFKSIDRIVNVFTEDRSWACELTLNNLEKNLDPNSFTRFHRGAIVNRHFVDTASFTPLGATLTMKNGQTIEVSRSKRKLAKELFSNQS